MARIRSIKPEFWTSAQVMECSTNARLMFIGMWNFADDAGRMPLSPRTIKAQVFPSDDLDSEAITRMLSELSENGLIRVYVVDGKQYLEITGWSHQRIDKPQPAKYPAPSECESGTIPRMVETDLKGSEGKGTEDAAHAAPASEEVEFFRRGKAVLGPTAGGLLRNLLKAKNNSIPLARSVVEVASTKEDPREYLGAILNKRADSPEGLRARGEAW